MTGRLAGWRVGKIVPLRCHNGGCPVRGSHPGQKGPAFEIVFFCARSLSSSYLSLYFLDGSHACVPFGLNNAVRGHPVRIIRIFREFS